MTRAPGLQRPGTPSSAALRRRRRAPLCPSGWRKAVLAQRPPGCRNQANQTTSKDWKKRHDRTKTGVGRRGAELRGSPGAAHRGGGQAGGRRGKPGRIPGIVGARGGAGRTLRGVAGGRTEEVGGGARPAALSRSSPGQDRATSSRSMSTSNSALGHSRRTSDSADITNCCTAIRAYHFLLAGTTYQGAAAVLVA